MKAILTTIIASLLSFITVAQNGYYDLRFNLNDVDCNTSKVYVDLEIRSTSPSSAFNISDQNFRFSFNRNAVTNPTIKSELALSGFAIKDQSSSFYAPHTLRGSIDTIVSYNIELVGGDGYPINTTWVKVGRIGFDILNKTKCLDLKWHTKDSKDFPNTFIGEKQNGKLFATAEGNYLEESICFDMACGIPLPTALTYFQGQEKNCTTELIWETQSQKNNDHFDIEASDDGINFHTIKTIKAAGTNTKTLTYSATVAMLASKTYYRLKQVDFDGSFTMSEFIVVSSTCFTTTQEIITNDLLIYPNPVSKEPISISFDGKTSTSNAQIIVKDVAGHIVLQKNIPVNSGLNTLELSTSTLKAGTYFLHIVDNDNTHSKAQRFIKVN